MQPKEFGYRKVFTANLAVTVVRLIYSQVTDI